MDSQTHLKLSVDGFAVTCFGLIVDLRLKLRPQAKPRTRAGAFAFDASIFYGGPMSKLPSPCLKALVAGLGLLVAACSGSKASQSDAQVNSVDAASADVFAVGAERHDGAHSGRFDGVSEASGAFGDARGSDGTVQAVDVNPQADGETSDVPQGDAGTITGDVNLRAGGETTPVDVPQGDAGTIQTAGDAGGLDGPDGSSPVDGLVISNLLVETNPKMRLGCYVSWTTAEAAHSEVQFGEGGYQFRIVDSAMVTNHKVYVIGMHPQTTYWLKAVSTNASSTGSAATKHTTGELPAGFPPMGTVLTDKPAKMQRGWTLTNIQVGSEQGQSPKPPLIVIVDESAHPVWYYVHGTAIDATGAVSATWLPKERHVLVGPASGASPKEVDLEGNVIWTGPDSSTKPKMGHHAGKLSSGNYVLSREGTGGALIQVVTPRNDVVWSWSLFDHIPLPADKGDWCHPNSVTIDEAGGFLYLSCRFQGLYKADCNGSGEVIWQMGAGIDSMTTGDFTYLPSNDVRFIDIHDPELHEDGTILFYDNQGYAGRAQGERNGSYHSRAVEYQVDQSAKQATLIWEFPGNFAVDSWYKQDWYTPAWGDADRQPNGNVLITAGVRGVGTQTRIFEVTRGGEVVWAMVWPQNNLSYRADRISPALAQELP